MPRSSSGAVLAGSVRTDAVLFHSCEASYLKGTSMLETRRLLAIAMEGTIITTSTANLTIVNAEHALAF